MEVWTEKTVKRTGYLPSKSVDTGQGVTFDIKELKDVDIMQVEEKEHHLGCLPIVELRNKQKGISPLLEPWSGKPELATWYPVKGLIQMAYHTLRQIGKNMILVKPKIVGDFSPQDIFRFIDKPSEMSELYSDMFISLNVGDVSKGAKLDILQGDMKIKEGFEGFQRIWDLILIGCGLSPQNEAQTVQTATEIVAKQQTSSETINLLKQLRIDQLYLLLDKVLIIERLGDGKGERPYTLSLAEEEKVDKTLEIQEAQAKIAAHLSNPIREIAKLFGVSMEEAARILEENIKVNSEIFEQTSHMQEDQDPNQSKVEKSDK